jgi:hypothetical protein
VANRNWVTVKCNECTNTQQFPAPRPNGWVCGDCITKKSTPAPASTQPDDDK